MKNNNYICSGPIDPEFRPLHLGGIGGGLNDINSFYKKTAILENYNPTLLGISNLYQKLDY